MNLKDLKQKSPAELLALAEDLGIDDASSLRKQELMFGILQKTVGENEAIKAEGTIEVMQDGFGFLRSSQSNYLAGPDDIYVSPAQVKGLDSMTVEEQLNYFRSRTIYLETLFEEIKKKR